MSGKTPFIKVLSSVFAHWEAMAPGWLRGCKDLSVSYMPVSCLALRTCCLACSRARESSHDQSQTLGDRLHALHPPFPYGAPTVCQTPYVFTLRNGGGNDSAFADCWIAGRELRYPGALFSILSTWLCLLPPSKWLNRFTGSASSSVTAWS